jgi:hypothetical protein
MNGRLLWLVLGIAVLIDAKSACALEPSAAAIQGGDCAGWNIAWSQLNAWWKNCERAPVVDGPRRYTQLLRHPWSPTTDLPIGTLKQFDEAMKLELHNHRRAMHDSLRDPLDPLR